MKKIRTRFAPSPTGFLHIGGARTALYSWLFSKHNNGEFILRIEDSDLKRSSKKSIDNIINAMKWLNLNWDEGPYYQTKRLNRYNEVISQMIENRTAYRCYCSKKRLDVLRKKQILNNEKPRYDGYCKDKTNYYKSNEPHVVRFCNPKTGFVVFDDKIRGTIKFSNQELDDLIIRRADGYPTYNFCVVIDDWDMKITHVIRGEDHINNTPRQINILKSLCAPIPEYAHVSLIIDDNGKKLSKRYNDVDIMKYRDKGFLPQAILNHLVRLGWSYGNQEIFSIDEMKKYFTIDSINKSASLFNFNKLLWLNHFYINNLPVEEVAYYLEWHIKQQNIIIDNGPKLTELITLLGPRCKTLKEIAESCHYFYQNFKNFDSTAEKYLNNSSSKYLKIIKNEFNKIINWTSENIKQAIKDSSIKSSVNMSKICMPLRVAVTGRCESPALNITLYTIGKVRSILRIEKALDYINKCVENNNLK